MSEDIETKPGKTGTATVRRGTVRVGDYETAKHYGPGDEVELPLDQIADLRARGVLHEADGLTTVPTGPQVNINTFDPENDETTDKKPARTRRR